MTSLREMKEKGYIPNHIYMSLLIRGAFSLIKVILLNLRELKRLRVIPDGQERYIIPKRPYEIPKMTSDMRTCHSEEKYLRKTLYCDHNDPVVVAIADRLGAYKVSDREFAERAFKFVKDNILLNEIPMNEIAGTFERGTGTCFHLASAYIALCRCAGIKARYKVFAMKMIPGWYNVVIQPDPFIKRWYDSLGYFVLEAEAEVFLDGEWVVANVTPESDWQAATGTPINRLGEDSLGMWYNAVPGTLMILESIPYGLGLSLDILHTVAPGSMERVNLSILKQKETGRIIIEKAGGLEEYDRMARTRQGPRIPRIDLEPRPQLIFDD